MAIIDLWPEAITTDSGLEGPATILKEQAKLLGQKTKNLVEAQVESQPSQRHEGMFVDGFFLVSSTIDYRFLLFRVFYPLEFYPAQVVWEDYGSDAQHYSMDMPARAVNSREELEDEMKRIFSAPKTIKVIQAMITRSRA